MKETIEVHFSFEAGHASIDGACCVPHGHFFILIVSVLPCDLQQQCAAKKTLESMIEKYFQRKWLNRSLNLQNATLEAIVEWIYKFLENTLKNLISVQLFISADHKAEISLHQS